MTGNTLKTLLLAGMITSFTTGCSGGDEYLFEHGPAGPNTEKTLDTLPEGLLPDTAKARHTNETHEPEN
ncbi:hypothetical protein MNBD_ALPHA03-1373 [hydrothermal vent metagenome]|uniref:Lipoprotein n=1 Tax=hydrothermal vent metagenome TaxID=652676 RepID=A0A3B1BBJ3_9ZZZZ